MMKVLVVFHKKIISNGPCGRYGVFTLSKKGRLLA